MVANDHGFRLVGSFSPADTLLRHRRPWAVSQHRSPDDACLDGGPGGQASVGLPGSELGCWVQPRRCCLPGMLTAVSGRGPAA